MTKNNFRRFFQPTELQMEKLELLETVVKQKNQQLNLIARSTEKELWERHILDSAQLLIHVPLQTRVWYDLGSGAGFPGLVIAILSNYEVHLVEKSPKKCLFLQQFVDEAKLANVVIHQQRVEELAHHPQPEVISARALAPIAKLLTYLDGLLTATNQALLHRGRSYEQDLQALDKARFRVDVLTSITSEDSCIFRLRKISA